MKMMQILKQKQLFLNKDTNAVIRAYFQNLSCSWCLGEVLKVDDRQDIWSQIQIKIGPGRWCAIWDTVLSVEINLDTAAEWAEMNESSPPS